MVKSPVGGGTHAAAALRAPVSAPESVAMTDPKLVWRKYCSFIDLSLQEFMDIQEELLMEQLSLAQNCRLGKHLLKGPAPRTVAEFRATVPLTRYGDYLPLLAEGADDVLAEKPAVWSHTTGAQAGFKWVPYTRRGIERILDNVMAACILAAASNRGDVRIWPGDTALYNTPARPYMSGIVAFGMTERFKIHAIPDPAVAESMDFKEKIRLGFNEALGRRVDFIISMTSVLAKVGEGFSEESRGVSRSRKALRPGALLQIAKAYLKSRVLGRRIMPHDLWPTKAIIGWGMDTSFFRDQVEKYFGHPPFEIYACTEGGVMAMQTWKKTGLVFNPYSDFYEFIPEEESLRSRENEKYRPNTVLLPDVKPGKTYEMVITNFYGMAFIRYRVGHFVRFLPDADGPGSQLRHFEFLGRADDRIDLAGFTRIDEKTVWDALRLAGFTTEEWTVRKEFESETPVLHFYIEPREPRVAEQVEDLLHTKLKQVDPFYSDLETMLGIRPLRVTLLRAGTFDRFYDERRKQGQELGRLRPPHMSPTEEDVQDLLRLAAGAG